MRDDWIDVYLSFPYTVLNSPSSPHSSFSQIRFILLSFPGFVFVPSPISVHYLVWFCFIPFYLPRDRCAGGGFALGACFGRWAAPCLYFISVIGEGKLHTLSLVWMCTLTYVALFRRVKGPSRPCHFLNLGQQLNHIANLTSRYRHQSCILPFLSG